MKPVIGIIGAKGEMGKAFVDLFRSHDLEVLESDIDTELGNEDLIKTADITIFSVPIQLTVDLINDLAPKAKEGSLLTDFTSIKAPVITAMLESAPKSCEILGLHPIFGPSVVSNLKKQVFAACPERRGKLTEFLLNFFAEQGAVIKETTAAKHDEMMSVVQGLTHISSIATAMALKELGFDLQESLEFSSPIYRLRLDMIGRILKQNPELYGSIAIENPLTNKAIEAYQRAITMLARDVKAKDLKDFSKNFTEAADFLGDFKDEAYERTSKLLSS